MKTLTSISIVVVAISINVAAQEIAPGEKRVVASVTELKGPCYVRDNEGGKAADLKLNDKIREGQQVSCAAGASLKITFETSHVEREIMQRMPTWLTVPNVPPMTNSLLRPGGQLSSVGRYDLMIDTSQGRRTGELVIKQEGDQVTGEIITQRGRLPLDSITLKDDEIAFVTKSMIQGQDLSIMYRGKIGKYSMSGDVDFGGLASGNWSAVRHQTITGAAPSTGIFPKRFTTPDITGIWNVAISNQTLPALPGTRTLTFKLEGKDLTGTYRGESGEVPLTGTVTGSEIRFTLKGNDHGQEGTIVYIGRVYDLNSMSGTVSVRGTFGPGEVIWTAMRER